MRLGRSPGDREDSGKKEGRGTNQTQRLRAGWVDRDAGKALKRLDTVQRRSKQTTWKNIDS